MKGCKIYGFKSHDSHILLEQLLPLAIRGVVHNQVYDAVTELWIYFRELCSKVLSKDILERLELQIPITLCKLEKIFPPAFFDVMVHLAVHLATEAKLAGPVQYRWMYPIERFLRKLKCYVHNKSRPEGSMAEGYIVEESLIFCSRYLHGIETKFNQFKRNSEAVQEDLCKGLFVFTPNGFPLKKDKSRTLAEKERTQAHLYVLKNCQEIQSFLCEYEQDNRTTSFYKWFHHRIVQLQKEKDAFVNEKLLSLAYGPLYGIQTFKGYVINGFRFHKELETKRLKQNSGVIVKGVMGDKMLEYYGFLNEIIELQYLTGKRIVLFKCDWWDVDNVRRGVKIDKHGFVSVNTTRKLATDEPFVLASQVEQVFYVEDGLTPNWLIVLKGHSESFIHLPIGHIEQYNGDMLIQEQAFQQDTSHLEDFACPFEKDDQIVTTWNRDDIGACHTDISILDDVIEPIDSDPETDDEDLIV